jgi:magnesium transporter
MISAYNVSDGLLHKIDCSEDTSGLTQAIWVDLHEPTKEQESAVEAACHVDIPTREEMRSIEASSQIYHEDGALVMTARVISKSETSTLRLVTITFVLIENRLITLRYGDPKPFRTFVARAEKELTKLASGETVMIGLLEAIVDRAAEILQSVGDELEALSTDIFTRDGSVSGAGNHADLRPVLQKIGRNGDLATRVRESLHTLARIVPYLQSGKNGDSVDDIPERLNTIAKDVASLLGHDNYLMSNVTFLLDATLGLINIQQNAIIKIFSVAAVIFLPPTLIASVYGMNFDHMPELKWLFGYPYALGLMVFSAIFPYFYFKRRGWL